MIMAVSETTWNALKQNYVWEFDQDGNPTGREREDLTWDQAKKFRASADHAWNALDVSGTNYKIIDMYMPREFVGDDLTWMNFLDTEFPGKFIPIACFEQDGFPLGIEWSPPVGGVNDQPEPGTGWTRACFDADDRIVACSDPDAVRYIWWRGTQTYPQHPRALEAMPDIDTDDDGIPDSPATEFPVHMAGRSGWKERIWI